MAKKPEQGSKGSSLPDAIGGSTPDDNLPDLARILMEGTKQFDKASAYPPPEILAEYKALDQRVFDEIVGGIASQREHRQLLEGDATRASIVRQNRADFVQNACSILSILVAGGLVLTQIPLKQDVHWQFPSILVLAGVGGRPVATVIASVLLKYGGSKG
jgi:hypothetical protein